MTSRATLLAWFAADSIPAEDGGFVPAAVVLSCRARTG